MLITPRSKARLCIIRLNAILWEYSLNLLLAINFNFADIISPLSENGFLGSYWQQCENHNLGKNCCFFFWPIFVPKNENFRFTRESLVIPSPVRELCLDWIGWLDLKELVSYNSSKTSPFFVIHIRWSRKLRHWNRKVRFNNRRHYASASEKKAFFDKKQR